ncbi:unnamed protein product, partial [Staurois parvus]
MMPRIVSVQSLKEMEKARVSREPPTGKTYQRAFPGHAGEEEKPQAFRTRRDGGSQEGIRDGHLASSRNITEKKRTRYTSGIPLFCLHRGNFPYHLTGRKSSKHLCNDKL